MDVNYALIFSLASVVAELLAILWCFTKKSCKTYLGPMLPPGGRNRQLISPHSADCPYAELSLCCFANCRYVMGQCPKCRGARGSGRFYAPKKFY